MTDKKTPQFINARRRGFLQGAAVASGAVATGAAVAATDAVDSTTLPESPQVESKGYRRTEHVSRYYARARF